MVKQGEEFFKNYNSNVKTVYDVASVHGHITDSYGSACGTTDKAYMNNCNYNQAYDLLQHLYPENTLVKPASNHVMTGTVRIMIIFLFIYFY